MTTSDTQYSDPSDTEMKEIFDRLKNLEKDEEIHELIQEVLPGWIVSIAEEYSPDYPHLTANWKKICKDVKTTPKLIVLVDEIYFDQNHTVMHIFCERMTRSGYVVRRTAEFALCPVCKKVRPNKQMHKFMVEKQPNLPIPRHWFESCLKC